ncbi:MAG: PQQ-like beta-propeller repeat protein [Gemmataceae bacterium]|nr:PQQ-like beta-propeller repeat protein [Gemmataceae bacterium]
MRRSMLFASLVLFAVASIASAADWYNWRGPWQNGVSPETGLPDKWSPEGNNLIWKAPYGSRSTPLVLKGRVYFINYAQDNDNPETIQERVMCLDADTGKLVWQHKFNVWHVDIVTVRLGWTNIAADPKTGNIYAHGTQGMLLCFDKDGKVLWSRSLTEEYGRISGYGGRLCSPIVDEDLVIIGMNNSSWGDFGKGGNRYVAMDKTTGAVVWWSEPAGQPKDSYCSNPIVAEIAGQRQLITGCGDGSVAAMQVRTGKKIWSYRFATSAINTTPVAEGNLVYASHGEESPDNNIKGRIVCLDASQIKDGQPKLVWKKDGVKARWSAPILYEGRVYFADEIAKLYCFDAKTGKQLWKFNYGRNARGSPVWADGKIFVAEVNAKFHILEPQDKKCVRLHEQFFPGTGGIDVEINGTPAIAHGRIFLPTSDEIYCIGKKGAKSAPEPAPRIAPQPIAAGEPAQLRISPAEITIHPGETAKLHLLDYDELGNFVGEAKSAKQGGEWSLPTPPLPPGAKSPPPALEGKITFGEGATSNLAMVTVSKKPSQQGYVMVTDGKRTAKARVRVVPPLPYEQDFSKVPDGAVPAGWVNTQGKFVVKTIKGEKVLTKVNDKASPLVARGNAYIGLPTSKGYSIQADMLGTKVGDALPEMGVVANRYTLQLEGTSQSQKLRLVSWDALPRVDRSVPFKFEPGVWYRLKLTVDIQGGKGIIKGKAWPRDKGEPTDWLVLHDPRPNTEGAPALYGYVRGVSDDEPGTEIYYDNVRISANGK